MVQVVEVAGEKQRRVVAWTGRALAFFALVDAMPARVAVARQRAMARRLKEEYFEAKVRPALRRGQGFILSTGEARQFIEERICGGF
jgi:hypothetical protein